MFEKRLKQNEPFPNAMILPWDDRERFQRSHSVDEA